MREHNGVMQRHKATLVCEPQMTFNKQFEYLTSLMTYYLSTTNHIKQQN